MNMTHKQGSFLFRLTGRKFWEPENRPSPTMEEAGKMIDLCLKAMDGNQDSRFAAVEIARRFFPDFDGNEIKKRFFRRSNGANRHEKDASSPYKQPELPTRAETRDNQTGPTTEVPTAEEKESEETQPVTEDKEDVPSLTSPTAQHIKNMIDAGITNLWLYGPAGTGKTTLCKQVAAELGLPCTILSCSAGTSPGEFTGFRFPAPTPTAITEAIQQPGVIVLDEMPMLCPDVAAVANALLANGELETVCGHRTRHAQCIIIATANTTGDGGNRQYIGNNQLDAATLDRFAGGFIAVDYDKQYEEANFDAAVCKFAWSLREKIKKAGLRRICSTRSIIAADRIKKAGLGWRSAFFGGWTQDDLAAVGAE